MKILIVEDDQSFVSLLKAALTQQHYVVDTAADGQTGWEFAEQIDYDLILLDVELPKLDGVSFCRKLRAQGSQALVLLLTARGSSQDKVIGLDAGADDYVVKPIQIQELEARMRALLRRKTSSSAVVLSWGDLQLDPNTCTVTYGDAPLTLTAKEYALLELLLRNPQRIFSPSVILDRLWATDDDLPGEDTVRAHVKRLRQKLKPVGAGELVETVYGMGYRLNAELQTATQPVAKPPIAAGDRATTLSPNTIAHLWAQHREQVFQQVVVVEKAVQAGLQGRLSAELQQHAKQECHTLIGTLGMVGIQQGANIARQMEVVFQSSFPLNKTQEQSLLSQMVALRQWVEQTSISSIESALKPAPAEQSAKGTRAIAVPKYRLLIVDGDEAFVDRLLKEAPALGIQAAIALHPAVAQEAIQRVLPDVVLLDLSNPADRQDGLALLDSLAQHQPPIPALVLVGDDRPSQVAIARRQQHNVLQKPQLPSQVLARIAQLLPSAKTTEARILMVDDDPLISRLVKAVLEPWGLHITPLNHPLSFWQELEAINPDLLILDVEMPDLNGIELCQMLRDRPQWAWLPIVFLTGHRNSETIQQIFSAGADDYVSKPIVAAELVTRILNRLERTRLLRYYTETDAMTGLPNRRSAIEKIEQSLQLVHQAQQPGCLCVLEIDRLRQINHRHGHLMGDRVLRQFAQHLRQSLHHDDLIARWDGAEFMVWLPRMTRRDGAEWLTELLVAFRSGLLHLPNGDPIAVTFSAGIAQYPDDGDQFQSLYQAASDVMEAAQADGDRILTAIPVPTRLA